ncbi:hypothetical protein B0H16DRAFT_1502062 [Mycena metata]|uniref:F-box domain-containing protein n=1 Tax=Mycena metata TaxID=1033252 RepID=A0AAD7K8D1_9AGAR|nr:hypothetical protein B0H16DRAFT_1502062 [Mycena metata]
MPPKKSRRTAASTSEIPAAPDSAPATVTRSENGPDQNANLRLVQLPPELFDAIIEHYVTLPSTFYYDTQNIPELKYYERNDALTALSQTCRVLRQITLPRLWERLDMCRIPERNRQTWYNYVMLAIARKANGISDSPVRHYVRILTVMFSKSQPDAPLAALWKMLPQLPNLRMIHVINLKTPGFAKSLADSKLKLPNVRTLFLPTEGCVFQRICPNATHIRCVGGGGMALTSEVTDKTEVFDGMVDWKDLKLVDRLVKRAPNLRKLEIRRPVNWGLGINSQNEAPAQWAQVIPRLAPLQHLTDLILTFPAAEEKPGDAGTIAAGRQLMQGKTAVKGKRRLTIRRVVARHYSNPGSEEDVLHSRVVETF